MEKAALTAELMSAGLELMRQNLFRRNPTASAEGIDQAYLAWLRRDGDSIPGDVAGEVRVRERGL